MSVLLQGVKYRDIPDAFWWVIVTVTTVGYGDLFPITWPGRGIGILTMMTGVFVSPIARANPMLLKCRSLPLVRLS